MSIHIYAFADEASKLVSGQIDAMKRNCLSGLEARTVDGINISDLSLQQAKELKNKLDAAGLITWSIGSPIGKIDIVEDDFALHIEKFKRTIEIARVLKAENIRIFSFYLPQNSNPAEYKNEVIDRLGRFTELNAGSGVTLCHENEKGIYGDMAVRAKEIVDAFPEIQNVFDPANYVQCEQDTLEAWEMLKSRTKYLHIKDARLSDMNVVPAGNGDAHVKEIVADYLSMGGRHFTMEPHLAVFDGLDALEKSGERRSKAEYIYSSNDEAFNAAVIAFKRLLSELGV